VIFDYNDSLQKNIDRRPVREGTMMQAVVFDKKNHPEKLSLRDVEKPVAKPDEVLVKVFSASINAADYRLLQMGISPKKKTFGADVAGIVEAVGEHTKKLKIGDCVLGDLSHYGFGGFAEYVAAPERAFIIKPEDMTFDEAASLPLAGTTALQAVREKGKVQKGDRVLIMGSSGGVGSFALQLAKYYGAFVTGVCSTRNQGLVQGLGVDEVLDYEKVDLSRLDRKFDLILGINGRYPLSVYRKLLDSRGRCVIVGGSLGQILGTLFSAG
jgi:NADPH:quinone reductase-like Zn-dependent oxidoreductase